MARPFTTARPAPRRGIRSTLGASVLALLAIALLLPVAAQASGPSVKTGSYKAKAADGAVFDITVAQTQCRNPQNEGTLAERLCIAEPGSPSVNEACAGAPTIKGYFGNFATPVQLPNSGKLTQHTESYEGTKCRGTFNLLGDHQTQRNRDRLYRAVRNRDRRRRTERQMHHQQSAVHSTPLLSHVR